MSTLFDHIVKCYKQLRKAPPQSDHGLAWHCMHRNPTFRLDEHADRTPTIGFRCIWRVLRSIKQGKTALFSIEGGNKQHLILEGVSRLYESRLAYTERESGIRPGYYIAKEELPGMLSENLSTFTFIRAALPIALRCVFSSTERSNRALHIVHLAEATALRSLIETYNIKRVYDFAPYHIDSNWLYLLLSDLVDEYYKLPSPGPLNTHNSIILCDTLVTSSAYHNEEIESLPGVRYKRKAHWVPEQAYDYIHRYSHPHQLEEPAPKTLGFYSHASWLRKMQRHRDNGLNTLKAEEILLDFLKRFLQSHSTYQLTIFLHPKEKTTGVIEDAHRYYRERLGSDRICFAANDVSTAHSFETVDIAIAAFSTILYERLFCGYKTFIGKMGIRDFPVEGSSLHHISFSDERKMTALIEQSEQQSRTDFFNDYDLWNYHHCSYPTLAKNDAFE